MASNVYGSATGTAFLYGITGTVANCAVQGFSLKGDPKNRAQVEDESGNAIERRKDDLTQEAQIEIKYRAAYALPVAGSSTIVYEGTTWEVDSIERKEVNKGHRVVTVNILTSQYINSATSSTVVTTPNPS